SDAYYNLLQNAFYVGDSDISKVDGYAAMTQQQNFTFPVGDDQQLRPLILNSSSENPLAKCAYFFEDPNSPSSLNTSFDTSRKSRDIGFISTTEFWRLEAGVASTISISWNDRSDMGSLTDEVGNILVVGWSKSANQWIILGTTVAVGDLSQGFVSSESFVPDDIDAITFGTMDVPADFLSLDNFYVSVNGDGINDAFVIPELEQSPNNHLKIYNRFGQKVFDQKNYTNQFVGFSNVDNLVISRNEGLPIGVYFYIVSMQDLGLDFQGFLYLTR
ncbi:MAG: gliding motility-associated C-terminal domain-containing protein, partial [Maribacter sp.]